MLFNSFLSKIDFSDAFEGFSFLIDIYRRVPFPDCVGYIYLNNITLTLIRRDITMCVHTDKDLFVSLKSILLTMIKQPAEQVCLPVILYYFLLYVASYVGISSSGPFIS